MLLTLSTTHRPATDLGYLLHKNPARAQHLDLPVGRAHVVYPEATDERCTAALLLEVDPVDAARRGRAQYVDDRPYAASSLLAVALGRAFSSARRGLSTERPELARTALPLEVHVPALSCRGGADVARRFFAPLGWEVGATEQPLDEQYPEWGAAPTIDLRLRGTARVADAVNQLYVALPVLDDATHYWVSDGEVEKLLRAGVGWLAEHPERELITRRYLAHQAPLAREALRRLAEVDDAAEPGDEPAPDAPRPLAALRHDAVLDVLRAAGAARVLDLGCGSGALLPALLAEPSITEVVGADVSARALELAERRLARLPERRRARATLLQTSLTYTDARLAGYDAAVLVEVVEHVDADRLPALEHAVLAVAAPRTVVVTTPNAEHNVRYPGLADGGHRHDDHRFEWTRAQFRAWAERVGAAHGYTVAVRPVGPDDPEVGPPTQLAVLTKGA